MKLSKVILSTIAAQGIVSLWPRLTPFWPQLTLFHRFIIENFIRNTQTSFLQFPTKLYLSINLNVPP